MSISKQLASQIVQELEDIVMQQINLMDENAVIIASSTPERVGDTHGGGLYVIQNNLPELVIHTESEYKNTKPGINLPLEMNRRIIGVVGITGSYDEVSRYGKIIKKMTEILIQGEAMRTLQTERERSVRSFLRRWIIEPPYNDTESFAQSGQRLGIDITRRWQLALLQPNVDIFLDGSDKNSVSTQIERYLATLIAGKQGYLVRTSSNFLVVLPDVPLEEFSALLKEAQRHLYSAHQIEMCVGASKEAVSGAEIQETYRKTQHALDVTYPGGEKQLVFYEDVPIELLLNEISSDKKVSYVNTVFKNCTDDEIKKSIDTLNTLYHEEGSITKAAEKLFIHKNTLQYQLDRLYKKTGTNPRSYSGIVTYQLAILLYGHYR